MLVPREKARAKTQAAENLEQVPITRTSRSVEDCDYGRRHEWIPQTLIKPHNDPVDPGCDDGAEALDDDDDDDDDDEENGTFSSYVALDDVTVLEAAEWDAIALLADTWEQRS